MHISFRELFLLVLTVFLAVGVSQVLAEAGDDWPQLQHDGRHSGYSPEVIEAPDGFKTAWQVPFFRFTPLERISRTAQVIAADNKLFVPTQSGNLYALDPADGEIIWRFESGEPIMHTAAVTDGRVFFATIYGSVFAVESQTGKQIWQWNNGKRTGFSAAVCLADGKIFIGGRGGDFHTIDQETGREVWSYHIDAPIYQTAAYYNSGVYFAAEDMHCYGFDADDGSLKWKSEKLAGSSFRDYYPLVHKGVVIIESMPAWKDHGGQNFFDGVKFPMTAWWTFGNQQHIDWVEKYGPAVEKGEIPPEAMKDIIAAQDYQIDYFKENPEEMLRFALDVDTGRQPYILPLAIQAMCGNQPPPALNQKGMLVMPLRFGRCGWGGLDPETHYITDIYFEMGEVQGKRYQTGHGGCSGDENNCQSAAGPWVFVVHENEHGPGPGKIHGHPAAYTGAYNLDRRQWNVLRGVLRGGIYPHSTNAQCGNNAISAAYGRIYHQAADTVHCWVPK